MIQTDSGTQVSDADSIPHDQKSRLKQPANQDSAKIYLQHVGASAGISGPGKKEMEKINGKRPAGW